MQHGTDVQGKETVKKEGRTGEGDLEQRDMAVDKGCALVQGRLHVATGGFSLSTASCQGPGQGDC